MLVRKILHVDQWMDTSSTTLCKVSSEILRHVSLSRLAGSATIERRQVLKIIWRAVVFIHGKAKAGRYREEAGA